MIRTSWPGTSSVPTRRTNSRKRSHSSDGAHQLVNRGEKPVRYLVMSNRPSPEAVEYPDSRQLSVMAFTDSQLGGRLWDIRTLEPDESES